jgi:hypothetical protein
MSTLQTCTFSYPIPSLGNTRPHFITTTHLYCTLEDELLLRFTLCPRSPMLSIFRGVDRVGGKSKSCHMTGFCSDACVQVLLLRSHSRVLKWRRLSTLKTKVTREMISRFRRQCYVGMNTRAKLSLKIVEHLTTRASNVRKAIAGLTRGITTHFIGQAPPDA